MKSISSSDGLLFEKKNSKRVTENFSCYLTPLPLEEYLKTSQLLRRPLGN
jgi:hypothetical protein